MSGTEGAGVGGERGAAIYQAFTKGSLNIRIMESCFAPFSAFRVSSRLQNLSCMIRGMLAQRLKFCYHYALLRHQSSQVHGYEFLESLALLQIETRKRGEGGQRWFDFGPDAAPTDIV